MEENRKIEIPLSEKERNVVLEILQQRVQTTNIFLERFNAEYKLIVEDLDMLNSLSEIIQDRLMYEGFDRDYSPNDLGIVLEGLIDKLNEF